MSELTKEEKLVILMEEASEVIKAASKCLRFGFDCRHPEYGKNDLVLAAEIGDMLAMVDSLSLDWNHIAKFRANKLARAERAKELFGPSKRE